MRYYVGLDVSVKTTAVCIVDESGKVIKERSLATEPATLADWLGKTGLEIACVGHESGPMSARLHEGLERAGLTVVCVEAATWRRHWRRCATRLIATMPVASPR